jgi:hypothetical protein
MRHPENLRILFLRRHYPDQVRGFRAAFRSISAGRASTPFKIVISFYTGRIMMSMLNFNQKFPEVMGKFGAKFHSFVRSRMDKGKFPGV